MGLSESYTNRKREESNEKARKIVKNKGCIVLLFLFATGTFALGLGAFRIINSLI